MSRLSEISFEPLEPYDGKLSCTVLRGERGSNAPDLPDNGIILLSEITDFIMSFI